MKTTFLYRYILNLSSFEYGCLMGLHVKEGEEAKAGRGTRMTGP